MSNKQPDAVSSVQKTMAIFETLSSEKEIGISELAQRLMMSKSTVYRFLQTMKTLGYVSQEGESERYALTLKLFEVGARALEYVDIIDYANAEMVKISDETMEALHLGALDEDSIIYIHKIDSKYKLSMQSRIGKRNPLYSTAIGKVLLADLPEATVRECLKNVDFKQSTPKTHKNIDELLAELPKVKAQGYGEDNEEQEVGLRCIAVPVYDRFGKVIAGLSISLPTMRFTESKKEEFINYLHASAATISARLGCTEYSATE
ncbi:DNA-binding transcriptional regulator KdgR [Enterovibrio sp. ZSDZ35]|uniref:DNA-binding transcriptional regulator KdgR n=1 Tax=Enterovibrio qingdaonensis TaxID=2899818 RepID=A0ABT5QNR7_9GAMM|nr:DNA-binding transcriptional regulator KdgR [Enterovibrio sp. ZSDZ35]MDD1782636.1 DNA-binding transcriptional regulator KdgR [Enterovibrio sp. ZSDZ35]